jgi:hypothetical protein
MLCLPRSPAHTEVITAAIRVVITKGALCTSLEHHRKSLDQGQGGKSRVGLQVWKTIG